MHIPRCLASRPAASLLMLLVLPLLDGRDASGQSAPVITVQPLDRTALWGDNVMFSVAVSGQTPLTYAWYKDGTALLEDINHILQPNTAQLLVLGVTSADVGGYWVTVSNRHGMATSTVATLTVLVPPAITAEPRSRTVFPGDTANFSVTATGTAPLSYQWIWNGGPLLGATSSALNVTNVTAAVAGNYQVQVSNAAGSITSAEAVLSVLPRPSVLVNIDLGTGPFGPKVGPAAAGQDSADYWNDLGTGGMPNLKTARGNVTSAAFNGGGINNWLLDTARSGDPMYDDYIWWTGSLSPVSITGLPVGSYDFYLYSHDGTFHVSSGAVDYGTKGSFEGFPLGRPPAWEEGKQYAAFRNVAVTNASQSVVVNVSRGTIQPDAIFSGLQVVCNTPWILQQPSNALVAVGTTLALQAAAESSPSPVYQWFYQDAPLGNGGRISGADAATLSIANAQLSDAGNYFVVVGNANGSKTSAVAVVQAGVAPVLGQQPLSLTILQGTSAEFTAGVSGTFPILAQWWFNGNLRGGGTLSSGSNTTTLSIPQVNDSDSGEYWVVLSNAFGGVTSSVAVLTVLSPPAITAQPTDQYVIPTRTAKFSVSAKGTDPLSYQWWFNGTPLTDGGRVNGTASPVLTIQNVQPEDLGGYTVSVSNQWGSTLSSVANLSTATIRFVDANNPSPAVPYTNWSTAAAVIQDAINAAGPGDEIRVTNGVYAAGSVSAGSYYASHRVALNKPVSLISINGPQVTTILATSYPYPAYGRRCAYLTNGAVLAGFTLTGGQADAGTSGYYNWRGAGVLCESASCIVSNCIIIGNVVGLYGGGAFSGTLVDCVLGNNTARDPTGTRSGNGGGAYSSILRNCTVINNSARYGGGGVCSSTLTNCLVRGNSAVWGAGAYSSTLVNCTVAANTGYDDGGLGGGGGGGVASGTHLNSIIVQNTAPYGSPNFWGASMSYCCTWPEPAGVGNLTLDPAFVDASTGNYRLSSSSPCINAGTNGPATWGADLDGRPRVVDGVIDIGAYEFQHLPAIVAGPASQAVILNSNVLFSVTAVGEEPLSYRWQKDGIDLVDDGRISGSTTAALRIADVQAQDVGSYMVIAANSFGSATSAVASLSLLLPPVITGHPVDAEIAVGGTGIFAASATGTEPLSYQWRKNAANLAAGGNILGPTTTMLQVTGATTNDVGSYDVVVSNPYGAVTSAPAMLSLLPLAITNQPVSQSVPAGTNVTIAVRASGTAAISYRWRFNQVDVPGGTSPFLSLTNVQSWNSGAYDVVVSNAYSMLTSAVAVLTVLPAGPTIVTQPVSLVASVGQSASFSVIARGSEPMAIQWQKEGTNLAGATASALTFANLNCSFNGAYGAVISNSVGTAFTTNVTLTVSPVLLWGMTNNLQLAANAAIPAGATNVVALAAGTSTEGRLPCLALRSDGSLLPWGYGTRGAGPVPQGDFVAIGISAGSTPSSLAIASDGRVVQWAAYTLPPLPAAVSNGQFVAVTAGVLHTVALRDDGTVLAWGNNTYGQTNVPVSATNIVAVAAGANHTLALRADGAVVGWGANSKGQAVALSNYVNVCAISAGGDQSLGLLSDNTVAGSIVTNPGPKSILYGTPPAWTNVIGISAGLYHSLVRLADGGVAGVGFTNYLQSVPPVYARNAVAIAAGANHSLALVKDPFAPAIPPRIGRAPVGRTVVAGQNAIFNALAVGGLPLTYQWLRDGMPVAGQTRSTLVLNRVMPTEAGTYQLVAENEFGSVTSSVAVVTVTLPQPQLRTFGVVSNGFQFTFQSAAGLLYVTEYNQSLTGATWAELERRFGVGALETVTDTNAPALGRFYRVRALFAPPPLMSVPTPKGSGWSFSFPTVEGANYAVQYKANLNDLEWVELSRQAGTGGTSVINDDSASGPGRFYRVKVE